MSNKTKLQLASDWFKWGRPQTALGILSELPYSVECRVRDAFEDEDVEGAIEEIDRIVKTM